MIEINYICVSNCVSNSDRLGVTVSLYLDERVKKKNDLFPVKLRVTHNRQRTYIAIEANKMNKILSGNLEQFRYEGRESYSLRKDIYDKASQQKPRGIYKDLQTVFRLFELEHQQIADRMVPFTVERFKEQISEKHKKYTSDIFIQIDNKIDHLKKENRFNSAIAYTSTRKALEDFNRKKKLSFDAITPSFLSRYYEWMLKDGKSKTTAGIYLRSLRSVFNDAISNQITNNYPFYNRQNKSGFQLPKGNGRKIALNSKELKAIFEKKLNKKHPGRFYVDSWKLLYLLQGMNPVDLCNLKYSNIQNNFIVFSRRKTLKSNPIEIRIPLNDQIRNLIEAWANPEYNKNTFIWPVFSDDDQEEHIRRVRQFVKLINKYMKALAEELKIDKKVTSYVSRHSFATQLMRHGAPVAFISKQLGHSSTTTTDNYLNSFEDEQLKEWQKKVTKF